MQLIKNPQFSPNFDDTLPKWSSHGMVILTKCHKNWVKIVDFLLIAYFWAGGQFRLYILYKIGKKLKLIIENLPLPSRNCATLTLFVNLIFFSDVTDDWYNTSTLSSKDFRMVLTDQWCGKDPSFRYLFWKNSDF